MVYIYIYNVCVRVSVSAWDCICTVVIHQHGWLPGISRFKWVKFNRNGAPVDCYVAAGLVPFVSSKWTLNITKLQYYRAITTSTTSALGSGLPRGSNVAPCAGNNLHDVMIRTECSPLLFAWVRFEVWRRRMNGGLIEYRGQEQNVEWTLSCKDL